MLALAGDITIIAGIAGITGAGTDGIIGAIMILFIVLLFMVAVFMLVVFMVAGAGIMAFMVIIDITEIIITVQEVFLIAPEDVEVVFLVVLIT